MPNAAHTPADPVTAYIGLGANLGDAASSVRAAALAMNGLPGTRLLRLSSLYQSAPVDAQGPDFINAVAQVQTTLPPLDLLAALQSLETGAGRERPFRNAPRTLDLDILLYADAVLSTAQLSIPHPRLQERRFVLWPLLELAPQLHLPGLGPLQALMAGVAGQAVQRLKPGFDR